MEHLGEQIYRYRTEKGLSQQELAELLDVSRQSVSKWEVGGAVPDLARLVKMAEIFDITLDALVSGGGEEMIVSPPQKTEEKEPPMAAEDMPARIIETETPAPSLTDAPVAATEAGRRKKPKHLRAALVFMGLGVFAAAAVVLGYCAVVSARYDLPFTLIPASLSIYLLNIAPFFICALLCLFPPKRLALSCVWVMVFCVYVRLDMHFSIVWYGVFYTVAYVISGDIVRLVLSWLVLFLLAGLMVYTVRVCREEAAPLPRKNMLGGSILVVLTPALGWLLRRPTQLWLDSLAAAYPDPNVVAGTAWFICALEWVIDLAVLLLLAYLLVRVCRTVTENQRQK